LAWACFDFGAKTVKTPLISLVQKKRHSDSELFEPWASGYLVLYPVCCTRCVVPGVLYPVFSLGVDDG